MKNVTKLLIVALFFIWGAKSFAQPIFGIKAGLNMATMLEKDDDDTYSDDYKSLMGFHAGVTAEFPVNDMFAFETGLFVSNKGVKYEETMSEDGITVDVTAKVALMYIDIPLTGKVYFDMGGAKIYGLLGPYVGMGLSGKLKGEGEANGVSVDFSTDVEWGSDEETDMFKRLDYGLAVGAGVQVKSIEVGLGYNMGLANISTYSENGYKANNRVLALSVAYKFGKK